MDIEKIREFVSLAQDVNFTAAAKRVCLSQPTLSQHMQAVEREVGAKLIVRGGLNNAGSLTEAGCLFLRRCEALLDAYDSMIFECRNSNQPISCSTLSPAASVH